MADDQSTASRISVSVRPIRAAVEMEALLVECSVKGPSIWANRRQSRSQREIVRLEIAPYGLAKEMSNLDDVRNVTILTW